MANSLEKILLIVLIGFYNAVCFIVKNDDVEIFTNITELNHVDKIMNGNIAQENQFPFIVSIQTYASGQHLCGGTLITPNHVLTAAHCMYYKILKETFSKSDLQVRIGPNDLQLPGKVSKLQWIKIHDRYTARPIDNDIAVVKVKTPLASSNNEFPPISMSFISYESFKEPCYAVGWGRLGPDITKKIFITNLTNTESQLNQSISSVTSLQQIKINSNVSDTYLRYTLLPLQNWRECNKDYAIADITNNIICAGRRYSKTDTCKGDSGGPLICNGTIEGIVSFGDGCDNPEHLGVYTRVYIHRNWIMEQISSGSLNITLNFLLIISCIIYICI